MAETSNTRHSRSGLNTDFPRLLMLLRKERGVSQKQVAEDLGISQALLSHYEKGIRECGLDFVVRAAEYYGVSCDYLLGRSPHRSGGALALPDIREEPESGIPSRVLANSAHIVFSLLEKIKNESLSREVTAYLYAALYKIFRDLYSADPKNPQGGIVKQEAGIHISNVNLVDANGKATKVAHKEVDGKKVRIAKTTGEEIK